MSRGVLTGFIIFRQNKSHRDLSFDIIAHLLTLFNRLNLETKLSLRENVEIYIFLDKVGHLLSEF